MSGRRKGSEKEKKRQRIIQIPQRINERGVPFLDDMVQSKFRSIILLQASGIADLSTSEGPRDLLCESFLITKFLEKRLMEEELDILGVVKGCIGGGRFGCFLLVAGLTREDAYCPS